MRVGKMPIYPFSPPQTIKLETSSYITVHLTGFKSFYFRIFHNIFMISPTSTRVAIQWSLFTVYPQAKPVRVPSQYIHSLASRFGSSFYQRDKNSYSFSVKNQLISSNKPYDRSSFFPVLQLNFWSRWITHSRMLQAITVCKELLYW